jgi:large subunit ribosomal protein L18
MITKQDKNKVRKKRHYRVRNKLQGTPQRPRLNVFRSSKHVYAQLIDDANGLTLAAASTLDPELKDQIDSTGNADAARKVGELVGKRAIEKGVTEIVFDRGGYIYHGRIQALAEGAREAGLKF